MTDDQLREFIRLSTYASLVAMSVAAAGFALTSYGSLWLGHILKSRRSMPAVSALVAAVCVVASYIAYAAVFTLLQAELEYRFTRLRSLCHLPGLLPRVLPLAIFVAIYFLFASRRGRMAAI